jgi:hypothetical protein
MSGTHSVHPSAAYNNSAQQPTLVDGIVDDIKGGDHIILFGQAC